MDTCGLPDFTIVRSAWRDGAEIGQKSFLSNHS
jgi:hypothetical protein